MEPNKLENDFRDKLAQRTIKPTPMAWDRLDAMLSVTEEKRKPKRTWMYIAASFLGFLLVSTLFFKQGGGDDAGSGITTINDAVVTAPVKHENEVPTGKATETGKLNGTTETIMAPARTYKPQTAVAALTSAKSVNVSTNKIKPAGTIKPEMPQAIQNEAVAAVNTTEVNSAPNKESDNLLAASLQDNAPKKKSSVKVDSNSLLSSVEGELDESFRNKALQTVTKNYNVIKTSLANRNHK